MRIASYYMQGHNPKECAAFLRREYGDGGYAYMGYNEWHDGKGIKFRREDDFSGFKGYDTVSLNWNQVERRIRQLLDDGRYLSREEQNSLHDYEMKVLARNVYVFRYHTNMQQTAEHSWDLDAGVKQILPILEDPTKAKELYDQMLAVYTPLSPDFPRYEALRIPIRDMGMFIRGEYSLFTPLPAAVLEEERRRIEERKAAKQEERKATKHGVGSKDAPEVKEGSLAAAARALAQKQPRTAGEQSNGQFSFFGEMEEAEQTSLFDVEPAPVPEPVAEDAEAELYSAPVSVWTVPTGAASLLESYTRAGETESGVWYALTEEEFDELSRKLADKNLEAVPADELPPTFPDAEYYIFVPS